MGFDKAGDDKPVLGVILRGLQNRNTEPTSPAVTNSIVYGPRRFPKCNRLKVCPKFANIKFLRRA